MFPLSIFYTQGESATNWPFTCIGGFTDAAFWGYQDTYGSTSVSPATWEGETLQTLRMRTSGTPEVHLDLYGSDVGPYSSVNLFVQGFDGDAAQSLSWHPFTSTFRNSVAGLYTHCVGLGTFKFRLEGVA